MKENEKLKNDIHKATEKEPLLNATEPGHQIKINKYLKGLIYLTFVTGIALLFNSCMGGYVAIEPAYMEYSRPQQPSNVAIWIEGDWTWNSRTHVYVQNRGYWTNPRQGRTYQSGYWKSTPRGKSWSKGYWQSEGHQKNNHHRK